MLEVILMSRRNWEETCWRAVEKWEKILFRVIIFGLVALVVAQSLLTTDSMRLYLSWAERLEGEPYQEWSQGSARVMEAESLIFAYVTIELEDYSSLAKANLLINGKQVTDFRNKKVIVKVYPGDVIELDGSFYRRPVDFKVVRTSPNILEPALNHKVQTCANVVLLGKVKFK